MHVILFKIIIVDRTTHYLFNEVLDQVVMIKHASVMQRSPALHVTGFQTSLLLFRLKLKTKNKLAAKSQNKWRNICIITSQYYNQLLNVTMIH